MKAMFLVGIGVMVLGSGEVARAAGFDEGMEVLHFFGNMPAGYSGATVTSVEHLSGGLATVRIHATREPIDVEPFERKISKKCVLNWTQTGRPVPFAAGMKLLNVIATSSGEVTAVKFEAELPFYRKRADDLIEVLLRVNVGDGPERLWLRSIPTRLNMMPAVDVGWSRQHGLVMSMFEASGPEAEAESQRSREKGIPMANVPGERILVGRDGWKKTPDLPHEASKAVVSPRQYISAGG